MPPGRVVRSARVARERARQRLDDWIADRDYRDDGLGDSRA